LTIAALAVLTTAAAVLRVISLNSQLWCDEIIFEVNAVREPTWDLITHYSYDTQHTFYALLAQGFVAIFGDHPWVVRLPAVLCGTLSIPALYRLGMEVTDRFESLAAAGILAVSYHHVWFSQNARGYTLLLLAALLATLCLVRGLRSSAWGPWIAYAVIVALGAYTHLTMVFLAISHALICAGLLLRPTNHRWKCDWRKATTGFALAALLTVLLYLPMLSDVQNFFLHKPSGMKGLSTPGWAFFEALNVLAKGIGLKAFLAIPALLVAAAIIGCGLWSYFRQDRTVFFLFMLPVVVTVCGALAGRGTMYPRFFFFLAGFALLILARGIMVFIHGLAKRFALGKERSIAFETICLLMACSAASLGPNYWYPKQDFQGPIAYIQEHKVEGDTVVTAGTAATTCYHRYYQQPWESVGTATDLAKQKSANHSVWLVYAFPRYFAAECPELADLLGKSLTVEQQFAGTLSGGELVVCRAAPLAQVRSIP
jgi:4-amino-4-deoxy-L-arabinose transferase-like glycosyltransferase